MPNDEFKTTYTLSALRTRNVRVFICLSTCFGLILTLSLDLVLFSSFVCLKEKSLAKRGKNDLRHIEKRNEISIFILDLILLFCFNWPYIERTFAVCSVHFDTFSFYHFDTFMVETKSKILKIRFSYTRYIKKDQYFITIFSFFFVFWRIIAF